MIETLIPHSGAMCLLERIVEWNADFIILATTTHRSPTHPLLNNGRLRALHLCEYGAQAMAVHGGLIAREAGEVASPGFLVSLRDVKLYRDYVEDIPGELTARAERLMAGVGSWQYQFSVSNGDERLAEGRAAVIART